MGNVIVFEVGGWVWVWGRYWVGMLENTKCDLWHSPYSNYYVYLSLCHPHYHILFRKEVPIPVEKIRNGKEVVTKLVPRHVDAPQPCPGGKVVERRIDVPYDVCVPLLVAQDVP